MVRTTSKKLKKRDERDFEEAEKEEIGAPNISRRAMLEFVEKRRAREQELWLKTHDMEVIRLQLEREGLLPLANSAEANRRTVYRDFEALREQMKNEDADILSMGQSFYLRKVREYLEIFENLLARSVPQKLADGSIRLPDVNAAIGIAAMGGMKDMIRAIGIVSGVDVNGKQTIDLNLKGAEDHAKELLRLQNERMSQFKGKIVDLKQIAASVDDEKKTFSM